jgi:3-oxoacyl-[acyl-carrier protein] reductase
VSAAVLRKWKQTLINVHNGRLPLVLGKEDTPENRAPLLASIPLGRFTAVTDVANAACFLASDEASYMTGTLMEVDGGRCI